MLYANTTTLPTLLQSPYGYDATTSGLVLSPAGLFAVVILLVVGGLLTRGVDARYLMAAGLITLTAGNYWMSLLNLGVSPWHVVWPRVVVIAGLSMIFAPLNVAAFMHVPQEMRAGAVGLLALLRNEGGSVGTSVAKTIHDRRDQFHALRLNERLDELNPAVNQFLQTGGDFFRQHTGDAAISQSMALKSLQNIRNAQSSSLAFFDVFWVSAALAACLVILVFLMRPAIAEKGTHIGTE